MSINITFYEFGKRKNSTKRPDVSGDVYSVVLKDGCTEDKPVFLINDNDFDYNYCKWGNHYYFIDSITYLRNNLYQVSCTLDVLATYKSDILDSTQYVAYSNISGGAWLADTRIPVLKDCIVSKSSVTPNIFHGVGWYILSVIGTSGCVLYALNESQLQSLINNMQQDVDDLCDEIMDWSSGEEIEDKISAIVTRTSVLGNAYGNAPSCIRSCIWVPLSAVGAYIGESRIFLGIFDTQVNGYQIKGVPITGSVSVSIPWHFTDWRRGTCEDVYIYLPLVGMVGLSADSLTGATAITINYSYTLTDGNVSYQLVAGNEILGTYGGNCATNYPIGINQQAGAGEIMNAIVNGAVKTVSSAIGGVVPTGETAVQAIATAYDVANTTFTTHPSCVGGVGGGSGAGLDKSITCYTVAHNTVVEPAEMANTMGLPTMKPLLLSSCSGYCQCVNAHVEAVAHGDALNAIDTLLNSGFYIE